jgi:hypothetical protein
MTPKQVLVQELDDIKSSIIKNYESTQDYELEICGFGHLPNDIYIDTKGLKCRFFISKLYVTRRYRDESCAVERLVKFLYSKLDKVQKVFWRVNPKIIHEKDFITGITYYKGFVRFLYE